MYHDCKDPKWQAHLAEWWERWGHDSPGQRKLVCWCCGATFYASTTLARYCSMRCKRSKPQKRGYCAHCGQTFEPRRKDARYCSPACRQAAYRLRVTGATSGNLPEPRTVTDSHSVGALTAESGPTFREGRHSLCEGDTSGDRAEV